VENLLEAWEEFVRGKRSRADVQVFERELMMNVLALHRELADGTYQHGPYEAFRVSDPKPRQIHKASVRDRLVHRALYRHLYPFFDRTFIADSYSCREGKGAHRALRRFERFGRKVSRNNTRTTWVLKCDVKKCFASIDHAILLSLLDRRIADKRIMQLIERVVKSFETAPGKGLPLGNLTSQLFVNVYLNELDQYVKHRLKAQYHIRYADDLVILSSDRGFLEHCRTSIEHFFTQRLALELHPDKVFIKTLASGVDFLGWVHFPDHRVLRTSTKRRVATAIELGAPENVLQSYVGLLSHGNAHVLREHVRGMLQSYQ